MNKSIILLICISLLAPALNAQEEQEYEQQQEQQQKQAQASNEFKTLFGDRHVSQIDSKDAILIGARGAWVIGHGFALGFAGNGFLNDYSWNPAIAGGRNVNLTGGYGGLLLEPIILPKFPVHISIPIVIGAGGIAYTSTFNPYPYDYEDFELFVEDAAAYFVVEPGVELEFNVVRFFRLAVGGYYRFTSDIRMYDTPEDVLNGWSVGITLKFGKF